MLGPAVFGFAPEHPAPRFIQVPDSVRGSRAVTVLWVGHFPPYENTPV